MLTAGRFAEYIESVVRIYNAEQEDKILWEMWLHKVRDKSYGEFRQALGMKGERAAPTQEETAEVIKQSFNVLKGFRPEGTHAH